MTLNSSAFMRFIDEHTLFSADDRLIVAVSGGVDSVVLCHLLFTSGFRFSIAHVNYGLRGEESDADESFVEMLAKKYNTPFLVHKAMISTEEKGIQEQARKIRYSWFKKISVLEHDALVLTAHHMDDQAETIVHQFIRGGALKSLTGMRTHHRFVIRPLLQFRRAEILQYATTHDLKWREDSSNASTKYTRNFIRHEVMPLLEQINPSVSESIAQRSNYFEEADKLVSAVIRKDLNEAMLHDGNSEVLRISWLSDYPYQSLLLWHWLEPHGFHSAQMPSVIKLCASNTGAFIEASHVRLWRDRDNLILSFDLPDESKFQESVVSFPWIHNRKMNIEITVCELDEWRKDPSGQILFLDAARAVSPIVLRSWQPGDIFRPLGMRGRQKISDFLIQRKVPLFKKADVLVLECGGEIAGIPGYAISDDFKITNQTRQCLKIVTGDIL